MGSFDVKAKHLDSVFIKKGVQESLEEAVKAVSHEISKTTSKYKNKTALQYDQNSSNDQLAEIIRVSINATSHP